MLAAFVSVVWIGLRYGDIDNLEGLIAKIASFLIGWC